MKGGRQTTAAPIDAALLEYAYPQQRPILEAAIAHGHAEAGRRLGMTANAVHCIVKRVRQRAARAGYAPEHGMIHTAPEGYHIRGVTQWHRATEDSPAQWVKIDEDRERLLESLRAAVGELAEPLRGQVKATPLPRRADRDLMVVYPMGDAHIGLYGWAAETGDDHNLQIAETDLVTAMTHLVAVAPAAEDGLLISVGDLLHADDEKNRTPQSGHPLDVDTRYAKVMAAAMRTLRRMIDLGLRKHKRMRVILARGNHDPHASFVQALCLAALYEREPRVTIDLSPAAFYWHRFGKCFIGVNHGDKVKPADVPLIMATDRPDDWSKSVHRVVYSGHWHHDVLREYRGCTVETIRTLAGPDGYTAEHGFRSQRDMKADVFHREDGRILRHTIGIRQVRAIQTRKRKAA